MSFLFLNLFLLRVILPLPLATSCPNCSPTQFLVGGGESPIAGYKT